MNVRGLFKTRLTRTLLYWLPSLALGLVAAWALNVVLLKPMEAAAPLRIALGLVCAAIIAYTASLLFSVLKPSSVPSLAIALMAAWSFHVYLVKPQGGNAAAGLLIGIVCTVVFYFLIDRISGWVRPCSKSCSEWEKRASIGSSLALAGLVLMIVPMPWPALSPQDRTNLYLVDTALLAALLWAFITYLSGLFKRASIKLSPKSAWIGSSGRIKMLVDCLAIACVISICLFPDWVKGFASMEREGEIVVLLNRSSPREVRIHWDEPRQSPNSFSLIKLPEPPPAFVPRSAKDAWQVRITALAEMDPSARAAQVWLYDISTPQQRTDWSKVIFKDGSPWVLRKDGPYSTNRPVAFVTGEKPQSLMATLTGNPLRLRFLRHPWSGKVSVTINGKTEILNLYSPELDFYESSTPLQAAKAPARETQEFTARFKVPLGEGGWSRLLISQEPKAPLQIVSLKLEDAPLKRLNANEYAVPTGFWSPHMLAFGCSLFLFVLVATLALGAVHILSEQSTDRGLFIFYLVCVAFTASLVLTSLFFPGNVNNDSMDQWQQARAHYYNDWHPVLMALLIHFTQQFSSTPALFTLLQGTILWVAILTCLAQVLKSPKIWLGGTALLLCNPALWPWTVTLTKDIWAASMALAGASAFLMFLKQRKEAWLWFGVSLLSVAACFRHNSITLVLVPWAIILLVPSLRDSGFRAAGRLVCALILIAAPGALLSKLPNVFPAQDPTAGMMLNSYVGVMSGLAPGSPEFQTEAQTFDAQFGQGMLKRYVTNYDCAVGMQRIFYSDGVHNPPLPLTTLEKNNTFIYDSALRAALSHPFLYWKDKSCNVLHMLQYPPHHVEEFYTRSEYAGYGTHNSELESHTLLPGLWSRVGTVLESTRFGLLFGHYAFLALALGLILPIALLAGRG
ncbi:MAG: hypothetical protein H7039_15010, partial [Bryobacteraceae bacterium]|nr:hypothetical protein [Bryobacteraceae bacterium]